MHEPPLDKFLNTTGTVVAAVRSNQEHTMRETLKGEVDRLEVIPLSELCRPYRFVMRVRHLIQPYCLWCNQITD
jgi:hypothetical protein